MRDRLSESLKRSVADYAEIRFEVEDSTNIAYRGEEVENVSSSKVAGGIVRACVKGGWGISTFDSLAGLDRHVAEACANAALVGAETTDLAETAPPVDVESPAQFKRDFRGESFDDKLATVTRYNDIVLKADDAIESSFVSYNEAFRTVHFASTRGACYTEERPRIGARIAAVARDGSLVQTAGDSIASTDDYGAVLDLDDTADEFARRAVDLLKAPQCEGGKHTVILDTAFAGVFIHEAFGHLSEADFLYENQKMRDLMHVGREMGVKELNVVDDGSLARGLGTQAYDDEGTPVSKTYLIKDGVLAAHLHSLETAGKMGEAATGNARAIRRNVPPIVRMTNTYIEAGSAARDELFAGVDDGVYACQCVGGQTMMEMFTFSAGYGYRVRNGEICELVRDLVLTGNVFETLYAIDGLGDDLVIHRMGGGCGKGGQSPLPVGFGGPHVRIRDVVVGGK